MTLLNFTTFLMIVSCILSVIYSTIVINNELEYNSDNSGEIYVSLYIWRILFLITLIAECKLLN